MSSGVAPTTNWPEPNPTRSSILREPDFPPSFEEVDATTTTNHATAECNCMGGILNVRRRNDEATMEHMTREGSLSRHEVMRAKITYHCMNPFEKYRARGRKPWKLMIQVLKIIVITAQIGLFGSDRFSLVTFLEDSTDTLKFLFLKDYSGCDMNVYTRADFFNYLHHAHEQYYQVTTVPIGTFDYTTNIEIIGNRIPPVILCYSHYKDGTINLISETFNISTEIVRECRPLPYPVDHRHDIKNNSFSFAEIVAVDLYFSLTSVNLKGVRAWDKPACYRFDILISFDNSKHDGKIPLTLKMNSSWLECQSGKIHYQHSRSNLIRAGLLVFDVVVVIVCAISLILSLRAVYKSFRLSQEAFKFFKTEFHENIGWAGRLEFLNLWIIVIIVSDCLTIIGSIYKMAIDQKDSDFYDVCSLFLGIAVLLVWAGLLRFLGYFKQYNVLLVTLEAAAPSVLRFFLCSLLFFVGYMLCGWIVLGPFHPKFKTVTITAECLYSLINGDDMYATFAEIGSSNMAVWIFSKVYLYTFICLFIYVVLSLFIGIISDSYERLKDMGHLPRTRVQTFVHEHGKQQTSREERQPAVVTSRRSSTDSNNLIIRRVSMDSTGGE